MLAVSNLRKYMQRIIYSNLDQWVIIVSSWLTIVSFIYFALTLESEEMIKARNEKIKLEKLRKA